MGELPNTVHTRALSVYSVELLYEASYETIQMFCIENTVLLSRAFEKSHTKAQLSRKTRLKYSQKEKKGNC